MNTQLVDSHARSEWHAMLHRLIKDGAQRCPRYTSYPPATRLSAEITHPILSSLLENHAASKDPIALYGHIPYCETLCFFCACNREVTRDRKRIIPYLEALHSEVRLHGELFGHRPVGSLHFGGGTPNYMSAEQMEELLKLYHNLYTFESDTEFSVELDPRTCTEEFVKVLGKYHCTRISVGVQDFDCAVQRRVNRIQSFEETDALFNSARKVGISSVGVDLIYGLPLQTAITFERTLERVVQLAPQRIAVYGYAHVASMAPGQAAFKAEELPSVDERLDLFLLAKDYLTTHGFEYLGFDHFVKREDPLWKAYKSETLGRSFMGYHARRGMPVLAAGASAISSFSDLMFQNIRSIKRYEEVMRQQSSCVTGIHVLPIEKGLVKTAQDSAVGSAIEELLAYGSLDLIEFRLQYGATAAVVVSQAHARLRQYEELGLVEQNASSITLTPVGRVFARVVASSFDPAEQHAERGLQPASLII